MTINEIIHVTHEEDMLEAHLVEHENHVNKFFIKTCELSWNRIPIPPINWDRFKRFNIEVIEVPESLFVPMPDKSTSNRNDWFKTMTANRTRSKKYRWSEAAEGCDYVLYADVDEIISRDKFGTIDSYLQGKELEFLSIRLVEHNQWMNYVKTGYLQPRRSLGEMPHTAASA